MSIIQFKNHPVLWIEFTEKDVKTAFINSFKKVKRRLNIMKRKMEDKKSQIKLLEIKNTISEKKNLVCRITD